jgi:oligopeptide transport system permease protein
MSTLLATPNEKRAVLEASVGRSPWQDSKARLLRNKAAMISAWILGLIALIAIAGPWVWPHKYDAIYEARVGLAPTLNWKETKLAQLEDDGVCAPATYTADPLVQAFVCQELPPGFANEDAPSVNRETNVEVKTGASASPSNWHLLGTDEQGRDQAVRLMYGLQVSLAVGLTATLVSLLIGVTYGATAGFLGGRTDEIMMRFVDILYALPFIFFVIILMTAFGRSFILIFIAIGAVEWLTMARIVRGQTLALKAREFIEASRAAGLPRRLIVLRHIVPNLLGPVVVYATLTIPGVILAESFLSFLGLGVQEPLTSLGRLLSRGAAQMETAPWLLIAPAAAMMLTLFTLNFLGDGLRDALDPRDR